VTDPVYTVWIDYSGDAWVRADPDAQAHDRDERVSAWWPVDGSPYGDTGRPGDFSAAYDWSQVKKFEPFRPVSPERAAWELARAGLVAS
jgi:hypothetical protein